MTKFTSRADLLIAAGESIKMQEKAGVSPAQCKTNMEVTFIDFLHLDLFSVKKVDYEFPLAVVEGKPVFCGDELYNRHGTKFKVSNITNTMELVSESGIIGSHQSKCSWNPPKPITVTVEYTIDEAKRVVTALEQYKVPVAAETALIATRKALEKA